MSEYRFVSHKRVILVIAIMQCSVINQNKPLNLKVKLQEQDRLKGVRATRIDYVYKLKHPVG